MSENQKKKFNLLPKSVFQERAHKQKFVDKTSLLSAVLPLIAVIVWIVFFITNITLEASIREIDNERKTVENELASYQEDKDANSLLVLKTRVLKSIVDLDTNPENFFKIVQDTITRTGLDKDIKINTYGRLRTGTFYIRATSTDIQYALDITRIFRSHFQLEDIQMKDVNSADPKKVEFEISFTILPDES